MLMIYGALMPLRMLEEVRLWKMREKENIIVLNKIATGLEPPFKQLLVSWEEVLQQTCDAAQNGINSALRYTMSAQPQLQREKEAIIAHALKQSDELTKHLHQLSIQSKAITSSPIAQTVIPHMIRESEYFLGIFHAIADSDFRQSSQSKQAKLPEKNEQHKPLERGEQSQQQVQSDNTTHNHSSDDDPWPNPVSQRSVPIGGHTLPPLPYAYNALEPYIDEETMRLHHDKHHLSYVNGLNKAESMLEQAREKHDFSLIKHWEREAAFHGAGHYLHTIFWHVMSPEGGGKAFGPIAAQINQSFGSFDKFKAHFTHAAKEVEGGGWAILIWSPRSHRLGILQAEKHQNLSQWDVIPLLVLDVWEHAYYLKYQNNRDRYIDAWWHVVNWHHVNERFVKARQLKWTPY